MCLIVREGARDFLTGQPVNLAECQDDHVFPKSVFRKEFPADLIHNRTLISKETNNEKRKKLPSAFMEECLVGHGGDEERLLATLATHFISPEAHLALQLDDFTEFVGERAARLRQAVLDVLPQVDEVESAEAESVSPAAETSQERPAVWLVRAGRTGAQEGIALDSGIAVIGWDELGDLSTITTRGELEGLYRDVYGDENENSRRNQVGQLWAFRGRIQPGDLVVLPLKTRHTIAIGQITGPYQYRPDLPSGAHHTRPVCWLRTDLPRDTFDQEVLNSLGAFMTVCKIERNGVDERIRAAVGVGQTQVNSHKTQPGGSHDPVWQ